MPNFGILLKEKYFALKLLIIPPHNNHWNYYLSFITFVILKWGGKCSDEDDMITSKGTLKVPNWFNKASFCLIKAMVIISIHQFIILIIVIITYLYHYIYFYLLLIDISISNNIFRRISLKMILAKNANL